VEKMRWVSCRRLDARPRHRIFFLWEVPPDVSGTKRVYGTAPRGRKSVKIGLNDGVSGGPDLQKALWIKGFRAAECRGGGSGILADSTLRLKPMFRASATVLAIRDSGRAPVGCEGRRYL
jgi:hypothetical protein